MANTLWSQITEDQYNLWKNNPVTLAMFQYYHDFGNSLQQEMLARWKDGSLDFNTEQEARGRINTLEEIVAQPYVVINTFYQPTEVRDDNDAA